MNFGDRLKQLRTQKNLTQPQLAQSIGIERSYLSKLENDKSVPGADIFQSILRALGIDVATFLEGVDDNVVHRELRQVPEVANHLNGQVALRVRGHLAHAREPLRLHRRGASAQPQENLNRAPNGVDILCRHSTTLAEIRPRYTKDSNP